MDKEISAMMDLKAVFGTALTTASAGASWLDIAEPIVTMSMTVIVGGATLWYTVERAMKLRKERKNGTSKKDIRP
jgi:uncharacterized membrane protein YidH (DUF202 family)